MIEKKDWEAILKNNQDDKDRLTKQFEMAIPQLDLIIELAKKKIAEFPNDDPVPDEIKDLAKEMTK